MTTKIRETIHHGDHYAQRDIRVAELSPKSLRKILDACTYITADDEKAARIAAELAADGKAEQGWVRYEIIRPAVTKKAQRAAEVEAAREELRQILPPGAQVLVLQRHVAPSGMTRWLDLYAMVDGELRRITETAATAMDDHTTYKDGHGWTLKVGGCGMDMHFATVYNLSRALYRDGYACTGDSEQPRHRCGSNDHSNDYGMFSREYDAALAESWDGTRDEYVAARQDYISEQLATSYAPTRIHTDGGYALTHRSL